MRCNYKKIVILVVIILMFTNSIFGSVVSDNDGSAFITKAEFDSLKNSFQSQIDSFNVNIDNKIDNAIASYLSGLKVEQTKTNRIINPTWGSVSNINGVLNNTFKVPNFDLMFSIMTTYANEGSGTLSWLDDYYNGFYKSINQIVSAKYIEDWSVNNVCYRNLVKPTGSSPNDIGDLIWNGRALRYNENWSIVRVIDALDGTISWGYQDQPYYYTFRNILFNMTTLDLNGYITDWSSSKETNWPLRYRWFYKNKSTGVEDFRDIAFIDSQLQDVFSVSINLENDNNGKTKDYEHIISHNSSSEWRVSNNDWPTYISQVPESSITASSLLSYATVEQTGKGLSFAHHTDPYQYGFITDVNTTLDILNDIITPNLGMFPNKIRADEIYQDNTEKNITTDGLTIRKNRPTLEEGFQLLVAPKDAKIEWPLSFSYTHVHNGVSTYQDNSHEVDIYVSTVPFTNGVSSSNLIKFSDKDFATTVGRNATLKWTMPSDGMIYVKWVPHTNDTYKNMDWIVTLDVDNSNIYYSSTEHT